MKRTILALLIFSMLASAALDQTYVQQISRNGASTIKKTMDMTILTNQLSSDAFQKMENYCKTSFDVKCSVNVSTKTVTITEAFTPGSYYSFTADYGIPYSTYTMVINQVAVDRFSDSLEKILVGIGETTQSKQTAVPLDLRERKKNGEMVSSLKTLGVHLVYIVEMPADIDSASAGKVQGKIDESKATFDLVEILGASEPIVVISKEVNYGYLMAGFGAIILLALAYMFMIASRPRQAKDATKKSNTIKK